jgi:hypothetical protein
VTALAGMFTDIRALRGVMALTTDQGKLYTESLASQKAAHLGAGATADTLKVQLQSVAAQWQILQNRVHASAVEFGTTLLPALNGSIHGIEVLGGVVSHDGVRQVTEFVLALTAVNGAIRLMRVAIDSEAVASLTRLVGAEGAAAAASSGLTLAINNFGRIGAIGTVFFALAQGAIALDRATQSAAPDVDKLRDSLVDLAYQGNLGGEAIKAFGPGLKSLGDEIQRIVDPSVAGRVGDIISSVASFGQFGGTGQLEEAHRDLDALDKALAGLVTSGHVQTADRIFGDLSSAAVEQGVSVSDLSRVLPKYNQAVASLGTNAKIAANETQQQAGGLQDVSQAAQDAAQKLQQLRDSAQQAFSGSFDIIGQFQPGKSDAAVTRAQDKLIASKKSLTQEEARYDAQKKHSVSSEQALANARDRVTKATQDLTAAQRKASSESNLQKIYADDLAKGQQFVKDIRSLLKRGLDPAEVERLLTAGPEKSGALARALSSDKSGKLIKLSNQNERQLANLAIRAANLMQQALDKHRTRPRSCVTSGVVNAPDGRWLADVADRRSDR